MLTVSVVIPSYNSAAFLGEALESVRRQTRPVREVIVVDDCSSDASVEVARRAGAVCLSTPRNAGPSAARNIGVRAANGDVVAFLDADDVWDAEHCATLVPLLERHPGAALAYSRVRKFGAESGESAPSLPEGEPANAFWTLLRTNVAPQMTVVARRDVLLEVGGYDESMRHSEDYDLWMRVAWRHPFVCSRAVTGSYRTHAGQATAAAQRMVAGWWRAREHALALVRREGDADEVARVERVLLEALADDLRWAWWERDRALLDAVVAQSAVVPGSDALRRRWQWRARVAWPLWYAVASAWKALPMGARRALRAPLRHLVSTP